MLSLYLSVYPLYPVFLVGLCKISLYFVSVCVSLYDNTGSPGSPMDMSITKTSSALNIHWSEGNIGAAPVTGYVIEARPSGMFRHKHQRLDIHKLFEAHLFIVYTNYYL